MLKIAICDDEFEICKHLKKTIVDYCSRLEIDVEVKVYLKGEMLELALKSGENFDAIFLDINLNTTSGVDIGKKIRKALNNESIKIIFVSWNKNYAMSLFDVRPFNFLLKPIDVEKVNQVLSDLIALLNREDDSINISISNKCHRILLRDIIYFESNNRKIKLVTINGVLEFYGRLKDIQSEIQDIKFIKVHKSYIINYDYILVLEYDKLTMINQDCIPISQSKRKQVRTHHLHSLKRGKNE